jgi:hypothetical protein
MGQELFAPPNVAGWTGGKTWLTSRSVIARVNFTAALVDGELSASKKPYDTLALPRRYGFSDGNAFYCQLLGLSTGDVPASPKQNRIDLAALLASPGAMLN